MAHLRATRQDARRSPSTACKHANGTYPAEEVDVDGKVMRHHRCKDCHIIISTS